MNFVTIMVYDVCLGDSMFVLCGNINTVMS